MGFVEVGASSRYRGTHDSSLNLTNGAVPGNYTLYVYGYPIFGNLGTGWVNYNPPSSYAGRIVISPVPEPATYAMLLVGLGLIGFSARRKMNNG